MPQCACLVKQTALGIDQVVLARMSDHEASAVMQLRSELQLTSHSPCELWILFCFLSLLSRHATKGPYSCLSLSLWCVSLLYQHLHIGVMNYEGYRVENSRKPEQVEEVDGHTLTPEAFFSRFVSTRTPVIINGHPSDLGWRVSALWDDEYLIKHAVSCRLLTDVHLLVGLIHE